ncbi:sulfite exporter TauE/SafE family protein [Micromonospora sp. SH-82]|uniref:sulfite exporter TauE/SafE family protein n=1 Tax=Micromonospora sp. SH-82 TaxID=3132938 RepID=UPI003EB8C6FD
MDLFEVTLLVVGGFAAGAVGAAAGGGGLITFPVLILIGLPPVSAVVTNTVALSPGSFAAVLGNRVDLPDRREWLPLLPTAVVGTVAGSLLLLAAPARVFELVVPFLVLGATATLALQGPLWRLVGHPRDLGPRRRTATLHAVVGAGGVYCGYFTAALGLVMIAGLALAMDTTMARVNALKNLMGALMGSVTVVVFGLFGPVNWAAAALLAPAALVGGYAGARWARRLPSAVLKTVIVACGTTVGLYLLLRELT